MRAGTLNIVGAGLAGALLAVLLARRGFTVRVFEKRPDPRSAAAESGRSINLALASRGIRALDIAGMMARVEPLLIRMRGRMIHELAGPAQLLPYGQRGDEVIYSVGRAPLNRLLIEAAGRHPNVELNFGQACIGIDLEQDELWLRNLAGAREYSVPLTPTLAADGGGSAVRASLAARAALIDREEFLDHDYKELTLPAIAGEYALDPNALHIWPRGGFMLIALPNPDMTFTATLFLAREGSPGFASLTSPQKVEEFFAREFPDALALIPDLQQQFAAHPQGRLGTVSASPWHLGAKVLLLGDAAHAMVPFHGQGMNAAFEDCAFIDALLDSHEHWDTLFAHFEEQRRPHAAAIAQMALENYIEMRESVRDARFARHQALSLKLEARFPERFIPRYSMVMFHPEIPYGEALRRGTVQSQILEELDVQGGSDMERAAQLIRERLTPLKR